MRCRTRNLQRAAGWWRAATEACDGGGAGSSRPVLQTDCHHPVPRRRLALVSAASSILLRLPSSSARSTCRRGGGNQIGFKRRAFSFLPKIFVGKRVDVDAFPSLARARERRAVEVMACRDRTAVFMKYRYRLVSFPRGPPCRARLVALPAGQVLSPPRWYARAC